MRQVDDHAEPVHLAHHFLAERGETVVARHIVRGVGPVQRHIVRERHVARAQFVVRAQGTQRILDRVPAFHAQQGTDLSLRIRLAHIGRRERGHEHVGIARDHALGDVDLLQLNARVARVAHFAGDVHRPELSAHHPCAQTRDVRHTGRLAAEIVRHDVERVFRRFAHGPRQIVVSVHQRRVAQQSSHIGDTRFERGILHGNGRGRGRLLHGHLCGSRHGHAHRQPKTRYPQRTTVVLQHPIRSR